jgi:hypothetical protein
MTVFRSKKVSAPAAHRPRDGCRKDMPGLHDTGKAPHSTSPMLPRSERTPMYDPRPDRDSPSRRWPITTLTATG